MGASNGPIPDPDVFRRDVLPHLSGVSAARLAKWSGLSRPYCSAILRGERTQHAVHWQALRELGGAAVLEDDLTPIRQVRLGQ